MNNSLSLVLIFITAVAYCQNTPVIGGSCKTGTADVQIGGKQTQFFLKCEINDDAADGNGIWVVKSRASSPTSNEAQNVQQHPKKVRKMMSNICEQDSSARESQSCTTSETCLQQNYENSGSYLQCDATQQRWVKRSCQQDFVFSFEHQSCIGHSKTIRHVARQAASGGVICTFTQCNNNNNPCNIGTCNNGYCCSSAPVAPIQNPTPTCAAGFSSNINCSPVGACPPGLFCDNNARRCCPLLLSLTDITVPSRQQPFIKRRPITIQQSCPSCNNAPQVIAIRCPGGGMPYGTCNSGYCSAGYQCISSSNMCCASSPQVYTCPGGRISVGTCMNNQCGSGYSCFSQANICCPTTTVCADGTQAAGACVNGQCGTGFTCTNNLCCASGSSTPRCLDGTSAVGACINGRCGSGYTCTTGNICCSSTTTVCPVGQVSIGRCVNNACPTGYTCTGSFPNNYCCGAETATVTCTADEAQGPCINGECDTNYVCDTTQNLCCPNVTGDSIGPCIGGDCPAGFLCVNAQCFATADTDTCPLASQTGPCIGGLCPDATQTCRSGICCEV